MTTVLLVRWIFLGVSLDMDLTSIWETFPDQLLSHGPERLVPDQAKMLDRPHQLVNFGPGPNNN